MVLKKGRASNRAQDPKVCISPEKITDDDSLASLSNLELRHESEIRSGTCPNACVRTHTPKDTTTPNGNNPSFSPLPVRSQITGQAGGVDGKVP